MRRFKLCVLTLLVSMVCCELYSQTKNKEILSYIDQYYQLAIKEMQKYKIPASITLSQGILESGWGKSRLAQQSNNHFGIKCKKDWTGKKVYHDDDELQECFRKYESVQDSYKDHSIFLVQGSRYAFLFDLDARDYKGWANGLKKAGYATNPIYAKQLINMIELYELYRYDNPKKYGIKEDHKNKKEPIKEVELEKKPEIIIGNANVQQETPLNVKRKRQIYRRNKCKYIKVESGDTWESLSKATGKSDSKLFQFNEVTDPTVPLEEGAFIYISKKKKNTGLSGKEYFVEVDGETVLKIAQKYAVQVEVLCEANSLMKNEKLPKGKKIILK